MVRWRILFHCVQGRLVAESSNDCGVCGTHSHIAEVDVILNLGTASSYVVKVLSLLIVGFLVVVALVPNVSQVAGAFLLQFKGSWGFACIYRVVDLVKLVG